MRSEEQTWCTAFETMDFTKWPEPALIFKQKIKVHTNSGTFIFYQELWWSFFEGCLPCDKQNFVYFKYTGIPWINEYFILFCCWFDLDNIECKSVKKRSVRALKKDKVSHIYEWSTNYLKNGVTGCDFCGAFSNMEFFT